MGKTKCEIECEARFGEGVWGTSRPPPLLGKQVRHINLTLGGLCANKVNGVLSNN